MITQDGWQSAKLIRTLTAEKDNKLKEVPDLVIGKIKYKAEVIPPHLIVAKYFAAEQSTLDAKQAEFDIATQELESFIEEHTADEGLLLEALNDKDKVTLATVKVRSKLAVDAEEKYVLKNVQKLFEAETALKKKVKELQDALDLKVFNKYPTLTEDEVKDLVVQDKWFATLNSSIEAEIERVTQQLANRVKELNERYAEPLPQITQNVDALSLKVAEHLKAMGLEW